MIQLKLYNKNLTVLKGSISTIDKLSDISFTMNTNGGQGECSVDLNLPFNSTKIIVGDIIKINMFNDKNKAGIALYTGQVSKINREQDTKKEYINVSLLGLASLLSNEKVVKNFDSKTTSVLIAELLTDWNATYGTIFTRGVIPNATGMGTGSANDSYLNIIQTLADAAGIKFYCGADGYISFFEKPSVPTHKLTNKTDIESIKIGEDLEGVVNSYVLTSTIDGSTGSYEDAASIALYGKRSLKETSAITGGTALATLAQKYVNDNKDPKRESQVTVNSKYNLESIKPGDTIKIRNLNYTLDNVQIVRVQYNQSKCILYLDKYVTLGGSL